jgi:hypothetical protein
MSFFRHHPDWPWNEAPPWATEFRKLLGLAISKQEKIMIDTSKILAEVARERTELASWKALSAGKDKVIADTAAALKVATDALAASGADTAALAQVQADLDAAATDLKNDNDEAEAAIKAGTAP